MMMTKVVVFASALALLAEALVVPGHLPRPSLAAQRHTTVVQMATRRPAVTMMSDTQRQKKGKVQTITKKRTDERVETAPKEDLDQEEYWRLLLHNDDIHTFEYVTFIIKKTVPNISNAKAFDLTMVTHTEGVSTIIQTVKEVAEKYCQSLQKAGLTASISPDANFKDTRKEREDRLSGKNDD